MKCFVKITSLVLAVLFVCLSAGCGSGYGDARVYFELSEKPETLDAQTASSDSELLIVRNIYEGLLRYDKVGKITEGACESFEKNGLVYTFKIKDGAKWSDGTELTSADFAFGLRRALDKDTAAPFASRLYAIKNAQSVCEGKANSSSLGVETPDDRTLVLTLEYEDENFENALTTSVAMPCNEEFFNKCIGKYGLASEYIISNGSYSITKWNKEDFGIRIYKNKEYKGAFSAQNAAVFIACRDEKTPLELLKDNSTDMAFLENSKVGSARDSGINIKSYQNICWIMTISGGQNAKVRRAFAGLVSGSIYSGQLHEGFSAAESIFPEVLGVTGVNGIGMPSYDKDASRKLFSDYINTLKDKTFPGMVLAYLDNAEIKPAVTAQAGHWQQNLSVSVNIKACELKDFSQELTGSNNFEFAVFPVTAKSTSVGEYLRNFGVNYSGGDLSAVQTELLKNNTVIPFAFENTNIAYTSAIKTLFTQPQNGYVDFSFVIKEE